MVALACLLECLGLVNYLVVSTGDDRGLLLPRLSPLCLGIVADSRRRPVDWQMLQPLGAHLVAYYRVQGTQINMVAILTIFSQPAPDLRAFGYSTLAEAFQMPDGIRIAGDRAAGNPGFTRGCTQ